MRTLVDSGVWIDYLDGRRSAETDMLEALIKRERILMGDLILMEILQGIRTERRFRLVQDQLALLPLVAISDGIVAVAAARNYRTLRAIGMTIRSTIDTLIATRCIVEGWQLLHRDRDYEPFVTHLGLVPALRAS